MYMLPSFSLVMYSYCIYGICMAKSIYNHIASYATKHKFCSLHMQVNNACEQIQLASYSKPSYGTQSSHTYSYVVCVPYSQLCTCFLINCYRNSFVNCAMFSMFPALFFFSQVYSVTFGVSVNVRYSGDDLRISIVFS